MAGVVSMIGERAGDFLGVAELDGLKKRIGVRGVVEGVKRSAFAVVESLRFALGAALVAELGVGLLDVRGVGEQVGAGDGARKLVEVEAARGPREDFDSAQRRGGGGIGSISHHRVPRFREALRRPSF